MANILIVDNNEQSLYLLKTILENKGHSVTQAENGSEALAYARRSEPSLVISDILMPVMDGFTFCKEWIRDPHLSAIPFVLYTATYTDAADEELGLSLGATRFLTKPQEGDVLTALIDELLLAPRQTPHPKRWTTKQIEDSDNYRLYSEALVRKLDSKVAELEATRRVLQHQIEERKQADAQLRLHAKVFEQAHEGIIITDANAQILSVNGAFCNLTGFSETDILGHSSATLYSEEYMNETSATVQDEIVRTGRWQNETVLRDRSGELLPVWVTVSALTDARERITHYIHLFLDLGDQKTQAAQIEKLAFFDGITGLPNRALLLDRLEQVLVNARRRDSSVAVLFLNLSRFKEINETRGHAAGDAVLREVTRRFNTALGSDTFLARFGGDEFVVVADHTDQTEAAFIAESLVYALERPISVEKDSLHIALRLGIALSPGDGTEADKLIRHADTAMHRAKATGKNHVFFRADMSAQATRKIDISGRLAAAIAAKELELFFQPQFDLATKTLIGAEALLRWTNSQLGKISPGEFIPIAEERGLMPLIGDWVFTSACRHAHAWRETGFSVPLKIAVNVSVIQLTDATIADRFGKIVAEAGLKPQTIEIELTETGAMGDPEHSSQILQKLKDAGFALAIDDFGVGHSSLVYLKRFAADKLKIDMSFVRGMLSDNNDRAIVTAIISMAQGLGMRTIAEGVESEAQAEALTAMGCDAAQGYLYGHPVHADEFAKRWLKKQ